MKTARLIPVCLISSLVGILLPRLFDTGPKLTLAAAGYLSIIVAVDALFGKSRAQ